MQKAGLSEAILPPRVFGPDAKGRVFSDAPSMAVGRIHGCYDNNPSIRTMKTLPTFCLLLLGLALLGCETPRPTAATYPAYYNPGCYVDLYEHRSFGGEVTQVMGPATFPSLEHLNGRDWGNRIGSIRTGPLCWAVVFRDKGFLDNRTVIPPATVIGNLGEMDDQIESIQLLDHAP